MINSSINLDISARCSLECPKCLRSFYKANGIKVPGHDMSVEEYLKIANHFTHINFCGNISDPVFNPNLPIFLKINYERNITCEVHNAASGKPIDWYLKAFQANPKAEWIFGIDGFPEESNTYRINQDGEAMYATMVRCAQIGLNTTWRYIVFKYNEDHIKECSRMASHYNIKFELVQSSRFLKDDPYKPTTNFIERDYDNDISKMSIR
jgi:hypothetical protein